MNGCEESAHPTEEGEGAVCNTTTEPASEWLTELNEDEEFRPVIECLMQGKLDTEVTLKGSLQKLAVVDFVLDGGHLKLIRQNGEMVVVALCSRRREVVENEYDVGSELHFLHMQFRCSGQPFPAVEGRPDFALHGCRCSSTIVASDLIPTILPPAADVRVECVLDAARILSIWSSTGSNTAKQQAILDPSVKVLNPRALAHAYVFFRHRCSHIAMMTALVPPGSTLRHRSLMGWPYDVVHMIEIGWRMSLKIE
ncbi:hypothetical protein ANCCAN_06266 [Ancylostoma caninum]|uniref:Uncharacterized protein n=1 Tax=Ancylostoma caninum TaxID=29170 RepID=A0A368GTJ6_ANCCA|nr:hypothetical protein ANCCAN_06266 [Ancylostoma caninum]